MNYTLSAMAITAEEVLREIGPVQEILDSHDGVVTVIDTADGNVMLSLENEHLRILDPAT